MKREGLSDARVASSLQYMFYIDSSKSLESQYLMND